MNNTGGSEAKHVTAPEHSVGIAADAQHRAAQQSAALLRRNVARPINPMAAAARARYREVCPCESSREAHSCLSLTHIVSSTISHRGRAIATFQEMMKLKLSKEDIE
jgi:hypothetical protein